jgi:hypothetical protein
MMDPEGDAYVTPEENTRAGIDVYGRILGLSRIKFYAHFDSP